MTAKTLLATLLAVSRAADLAEHGMRPFTAGMPGTPEQLEVELAGVAPGRPVMEHGQFRDGVSCAGALVRRKSGDDQWWCVVVSTRDDDMPAAVK
ncbi:MAG TPA: hypothetical protein VFR23_17420 [Jiangellaceae bacterium]|nr:hypothetical protein [Jiangellaceae bacterium]